MSEYLARRRARHEAAASEPWYASGRYVHGSRYPRRIAESAHGNADDMAYIAAARNDEAKTLAVLEAAAKLGPQDCYMVVEYQGALLTCGDCPTCCIRAAVAALGEAV